MFRTITLGMVCLAWMGAAPCLAASTLNFTSSTGPDLGKIADPGVGATTFTVSSAGIVSQTGPAVRVTSGTAINNLLFTCSAGNCTNYVIQIAATGSPAGRMGAVTNFTVAAGVPAPNALNSITGSGTPTLSFNMSVGPGQTAQLHIGMDIPIADNASSAPSGNASSSFSVTSATPGYTGGTGTATATIQRPISVAKTTDLVFGRLVRPSAAAGNGTVTINNATGLRTVTGTIGADPNPSPTRAAYTVSGEGSTTFTISVPASVTLTSGGNSLVATLTATATGSQTLSGALGSSGSFALGVGGSIPITNTTVSGAYAGSFVVTVSYN